MFKRDFKYADWMTTETKHATQHNTKPEWQEQIYTIIQIHTHTIEKTKISLGKDIIDWSLIF